jgi:inner membrane transporter RhtA
MWPFNTIMGRNCRWTYTISATRLGPMVARTRSRRVRARPPGAGAAWLVVGSVVSVQCGQALGKTMFGSVGAGGVVTLRLGFAALMLLVIWRPRLPTRRCELGPVMALGTAIAGMNLVYPALAHLPVGVAVTLQYLGPFAVSLAGARRLRDLAWAVLAGGGVLAFFGPDAPSSSIGAALALLSGASMGAYVVLSRRIGGLTADGSLLSWAVAWAALVSLAGGLWSAGPALTAPQALWTGAAVAVLSAVVPYSLDLAALRRLPPRVVAVLESLEPVAGGLAGLVLLGEVLGASQWLAIGCVSVASLGAAVTANR